MDNYKNYNDYMSKISNYSAVLILENGEFLWGQGIGAIKNSIAELCFNTSMTGYQEILTDPSYSKQIITFTFPHIGIVGTNENDNESSTPFASGCVISEQINSPSNWRSKQSLIKWLIKNNLPCISNVDTRYLTRILAKNGAIKAALCNFGKEKINFDLILNELKNWNGLENLDLAKIVSTKKPYILDESEWIHEKNNFLKNKINNETIKIVCIDYGVKKNILRSLNKKNLEITVVPANTSFEKIISYNPKGIFLSNGPGDPYATSEYSSPIIKKLLKIKIPIFGICLGHQLLCLALGAKTKKMFQGHRGANHPVKNILNNSVEITTQNHGFEVIANSLSKEVKQTHFSLFDNTNEGIEHKSLPVFSVQYHPEASPGPHDSHYLFEKFYDKIKIYAKKN